MPAPGNKPNNEPLLWNGMTVEEALLEDRRMHDFIGRHLPFTLEHEPVEEPYRYELGDEDWLDLLIVYSPGWGWEVEVLARSSEDVSLTDVESHLRQQLRRELAVVVPAKEEPAPNAVLNNILTRLERLERQEPKPVELPSIQTPYLNAEEAAGYLRIDLNSLYGLVERRRLVPLRGPRRRYRFTTEMLDRYLQGGDSKR